MKGCLGCAPALVGGFFSRTVGTCQCKTQEEAGECSLQAEQKKGQEKLNVCIFPTQRLESP